MPSCVGDTTVIHTEVDNLAKSVEQIALTVSDEIIKLLNV